MKTNARMHETNFARGLKAVSLAVVLGIVAVIAKPPMATHDTLVSDAATSAPVVTSAPDYFPSHYPAPTTPAEAMPTF